MSATMKRSFLLIGLLGLAGVVLGCGSVTQSTSTTTGSSGGGQGGAGGAPETTGQGGEPGTTGQGGEPGTTGQGGSVTACPPVEVFKVEIDKNDEPFYEDCSLPMAWEIPDSAIQGAVTQSTSSSFELDACANVNCKTPELYQVRLGNLGPTSGVPFSLPVGTYVELRHMRFHQLNGCGYALVVTNLPELHSMPNPIEGGSALWLQGQGGQWVPNTPVKGSLGTSHPCGILDSETTSYGGDMIVSTKEQSVVVETGTVVTWSPGTTDLPGAYAVKNLTSQMTPLGTLESEVPSEINFVISRAPVK